uniref:Retroviral polymerase SH3-like domain-containing protein n=1 Tax=Solanum lycopersicum TaxID=4081 RepID=K4BRJ7_SOLLC
MDPASSSVSAHYSIKASPSCWHLHLGYSPSHLGHRCLDRSTQRFYTARHIKFDESKFLFAEPSILGPSPSQPTSSHPSVSLPIAIPPNSGPPQQPTPPSVFAPAPRDTFHSSSSHCSTSHGLHQTTVPITSPSESCPSSLTLTLPTPPLLADFSIYNLVPNPPLPPKPQTSRTHHMKLRNMKPSTNLASAS